MDKKISLLSVLLLILVLTGSVNAADADKNQQNQTCSIQNWKTNQSARSRSSYNQIITITNSNGNPVQLQCWNSKWKTVKTFNTKRTENQKIVIDFPKALWWKESVTKWRLFINDTTYAKGCQTAMLKLKTLKYYQNPKKYIQIKNDISTHGRHYWIQKVKTNNASTRSQHINTMISTAKKYLGDKYRVCRSGKPGSGVDCSGLVMQACYSSGIDLWPSNPYRHKFPKYEYESRNIAKMKILKTVALRNIKRGDLVFYSKGGKVIHIAIYLGKGQIIHSYPPKVSISKMRNNYYGTISKVKRIFN